MLMFYTPLVPHTTLRVYPLLNIGGGLRHTRLRIYVAAFQVNFDQGGWHIA